ncbi:single-stranded DNA-binding protein [Amycolatopsis circi]|uniref:single-stranded DNA-binding protein n=1 Tax=Amycolatopsis circi TaxID=871959 RepID=UPI000E270276|nr:single-stranded DNA-binding protein [Amycolatopsis circi]
MAGDTVITIIGNLTSDPELRFTANGTAVANFTIASTPRTFNRSTSQFEDCDPLFMRCTMWKEKGENVAESLKRGMRVIAQGRLRQRTYETRDGESRTVVELTVDEIGPSLSYATAKVTKPSRKTAADPWAAAPAGEGELVGAGANTDSEAPPF